ncbi:hypothetical protein [Nocardia sp. JMUB6875]|uniref:hypothetical protein n=1 Tax=Nocardia sp. JMUB6875 TaxID=3158170 RepID=UPI0034E8A550
MRKSVVAVALLALPLLSACSNSQEAATPTPTAAVSATSAAATTTPATTVSGGATTTPGTSPGATTSPGGSAAPGGTLTVDQVSKALQDKGKLSQTTADCVANIYIQEGLSDSGIQKIIDSANSTNPAKVSLGTDDLIKAGKATKRIATECSK